MPDQDTVQVQMPDGRILTGPRKNLSIAIQMGGKVYDPSKAPKPKEEGTATKVARGATLGAFSGLGIPETQNPIADIGKGLESQGKEQASHPIRAALEGGTIGPLMQAVSVGKSIYGAGKEAVSGARSGDPEQAAHGASSALTQLLMMKGITKIPDVAAGRSEVGAAGKSLTREFMGVADKDVQPIIEKSKTDVAKAEATHAQKVEAIKQKTADKIADVQARKVEASKATTAAETKQAALITKKGPVYQRITDMADEAQANVREVDKKVRALEGARWNAFERKIDHPVVDWEPVQQAVAEAEDTMLKGSPENIAIFKSIMKEGDGPAGLDDASVFRGRGGGVDVKEFLSSIKDPAKRQQFIRDMQARGEDIGEGGSVPKEGATVPFQTARGFATEFNEKIYGRDLPSDVRRALRYVQDANDRQIVKAVAQAGGKDAVAEYQGLRSRWRDYMKAFYDKDSPIRKLKQGADPNDKLNPITGDEGERAISLFGKYRDLGADVQALGKIRALQKSLKELPSGKGKIPAGVEKPKIPDAPTTRALTLEEARRQKLEGAAKTYSHPPSRWELMFPPLHGYRLILKNLLQSKGFRDWLSKGDGGGVVPSN
jgi:hypothetical protein